MKIYRDNHLGGFTISFGIIELLFWKWGFGIDKREYLEDIKKWGYRNIFRVNL